MVWGIATDALVSTPPATAAVASISLRVSSRMGFLHSCLMVHCCCVVHWQKSLLYGLKSLTAPPTSIPRHPLIPPELLIIPWPARKPALSSTFLPPTPRVTPSP